jgi:tetratricopeptide (TPR) repeat protein
MGDESWDERIATFWASADEGDADATMAAMKGLVDERPAGDPDALYEWASVHDFLGREDEAVPFYRAAIEAGLSGERHPQAVIQLASTLRNIREAQAAVDLLKGCEPDAVVGSAGQAFLALALYDAGQPAEALRVALRALAPTLPLYSRAVLTYADALTDPKEAR